MNFFCIFVIVVLIMFYYLYFVKHDTYYLKTDYLPAENIAEYYDKYNDTKPGTTVGTNIISFQDASNTLYTYTNIDDKFVLTREQKLNTPYDFWQQNFTISSQNPDYVLNSVGKKYEHLIGKQLQTNFICADKQFGSKTNQPIPANMNEKILNYHHEFIDIDKNRYANPVIGNDNRNIDINKRHWLRAKNLNVGNFSVSCENDIDITHLSWSDNVIGGDPCQFQNHNFKHVVNFNLENILERNEYYMCENSKSVRKSCDSSTIFNTLTFNCDALDDCHDRPDGTKFPSQDRTTYVQCLNGEGTLFHCSPDKYFNIDANECVDNMCVDNDDEEYYKSFPFNHIEYNIGTYKCKNELVYDRHNCLLSNVNYQPVDHFAQNYSHIPLATDSSSILPVNYATKYNLMLEPIWPLNYPKFLIHNEKTNKCETVRGCSDYDLNTIGVNHTFPVARHYLINRDFDILKDFDSVNYTRCEKNIANDDDDADLFAIVDLPPNERYDIYNNTIVNKCSENPKQPLLTSVNPFQYYDCDLEDFANCPGEEYFSIRAKQCAIGLTSKLKHLIDDRNNYMCSGNVKANAYVFDKDSKYLFHCVHRRAVGSLTCPHPYSEINDRGYCTFPYDATYYDTELPTIDSKYYPYKITKDPNATTLNSPDIEKHFSRIFDNPAVTELTRTKYSNYGCTFDTVYDDTAKQCRIPVPQCANGTIYNAKYHACVAAECSQFVNPMAKVVWELDPLVEKLQFFPSNEYACTQNIKNVVVVVAENPTKKNLVSLPILHIDHNKLKKPLCNPRERWDVLRQTCVSKSASDMPCEANRRLINGFPQHYLFFTTCQKKQPFMLLPVATTDIVTIDSIDDGDEIIPFNTDQSNFVISDCSKYVDGNAVQNAQIGNVFTYDNVQIPRTNETDMQQVFQCGPTFRYKLQFKDELYTQIPQSIL